MFVKLGAERKRERERRQGLGLVEMGRSLGGNGQEYGFYSIEEAPGSSLAPFTRDDTEGAAYELGSRLLLENATVWSP